MFHQFNLGFNIHCCYILIGLAYWNAWNTRVEKILPAQTVVNSAHAHQYRRPRVYTPTTERQVGMTARWPVTATINPSYIGSKKWWPCRKTIRKKYKKVYIAFSIKTKLLKFRSTAVPHQVSCVMHSARWGNFNWR